MTLSELDLITGHTSEETALHVEDYPYGRTVRTTIRYWIESVPRKGDRFCSQTLNPKTGRWNKPKKSTYSDVMFLYREADTGYIKHTGLTTWAKPEVIQEWVEKADLLNETQRGRLAYVIGMNKAMEKVTWSVDSEAGSRTPEEQAAHDAEQERIKGDINKLIAVRVHQANKELQS
jgi:hypothetical protein